jgi:hypothetical protein
MFSNIRRMKKGGIEPVIKDDAILRNEGHGKQGAGVCTQAEAYGAGN